MIPVRNIYYMLAYAFQALKEDGYAHLASEDFPHVCDLMAAILAQGIANQIKRGLGREYMARIDELSTPTGKIDISASVRQGSLRRKRLLCEFDEFTENALLNQVLKATALLLVRAPAVAEERRKALKKLLPAFFAVEHIDPKQIPWRRIRYDRNSAAYKMLMAICRMTIRGLLITERGGVARMARFLDEQSMHQLYERFVREYYRRHYPGFHVSSAQIGWDLDDGEDGMLLPKMQSDITIEYGGRTLIIDTKYYSHTMQSNGLFGSLSLHSGNLYQIFAYVKNRDRERTGMVSGLLLYAKTDEDVTPDASYRIGGNHIGVKTLDLNREFSEIRKELDGVVDRYF